MKKKKPFFHTTKGQIIAVILGTVTMGFLLGSALKDLGLIRPHRTHLITNSDGTTEDLFTCSINPTGLYVISVERHVEDALMVAKNYANAYHLKYYHVECWVSTR